MIHILFSQFNEFFEFLISCQVEKVKIGVDSVRKILWNLRSSEERAFDRQSKGPGLDTQRRGSVPFFTEKFFKNIHLIKKCCN